MNQNTDERECRLTDELTRALFERFQFGDRLRNKTRAIKRALTSLRNEVSEIEQFMSDEERTTYRQSMQVIDRWVGKAERAWKERERVRKAEEQRRQQRRLQAEKLLRACYPADGHRQQIIIGNALSRARNGAISIRFLNDLQDELRWVSQRITHNRVQAIRRTIAQAYETEIDHTASTADYQEQPVDELFNNVAAPKIDAALATSERECAGAIAEIETLIAKVTLETANPNTGKAKQ